MSLKGLSRLFPSWQNALLTLLSAVLLILAFPPFEWWFTAWFALVPLLLAVQRERAVGSSFTLGWVFGNVFFLGTCWWLTFAPITYAGFPAPLAYFLLFCVTSVASVFPGMFSAITAFLMKRFGSIAFLWVPLVWVSSEFARYWVTGNNWNAVGYSQAFVPEWTILANPFGFHLASVGGVLLVSFLPVLTSSLILHFALRRRLIGPMVSCFFLLVLAGVGLYRSYVFNYADSRRPPTITAQVVALQPNVPMSGLSLEKWRELRQRHVRLAESALNELGQAPITGHRPPTTVIFPESPMNFMYEDEPETKEFINGFAGKNNVSVLFNSAEPDRSNGKFFNSAVMVDPRGNKVAQYDKIYLLPFGEAVPVPLESIVPAFVGSFSYGQEYDLLPIGDAKAGVMICFESHFGQLSREYVRNGADVIIEMTNDGYLGPTPVLRQHLANAVFRAVETNRTVLRATNVGITSYINERGRVQDAAESYVEDTRVWSVSRSDGSQTFYVKYGDWFAWLCTFVTVGLLGFAYSRRSRKSVPPA